MKRYSLVLTDGNIVRVDASNRFDAKFVGLTEYGIPLEDIDHVV